jgi:hypothetical protein
MNRLKHGSIAVGAPGSDARRIAELEDENAYLRRLLWVVGEEWETGSVSEETIRTIDAVLGREVYEG